MLRMTMVVALLLSGCAPSKYCLDEQPYAKAPSIAPIKPVEGVELPQSSAALKIPPPPENTVPFGETIKNEKGEEVVSCLDRPPPMPKPAEPVQEIRPATPKPAPPTPAAPAPAPG